jgi:hypothetical protein
VDVRDHREKGRSSSVGLRHRGRRSAEGSWRLYSEVGGATLYLRQRNVISQKEEVFVTSLYTLVSDEAIHPLIAEREYARLFRNVVIEYCLLFLTTLEKKGLSLKPAP